MTSPRPASVEGAGVAARRSGRALVRRVRLRARVRQGRARVRRALVPVLLASLAAGTAWAIARHGLGHVNPVFAPVAAFVALGFAGDRHPRRVAELAVGVALGVLFGDIVVNAIGVGPVQVAVVLAMSTLVARFVDRGSMLTMQAGVQSMVVIALPAWQVGAPFARWLDAAVGGSLALVVTALWPQDPRRRVRALGEEALGDVAAVLHGLASGLRDGDRDDVDEALARARASQAVLDQWRDVAADVSAGARVSPAHRRHLPELRALQAAAVSADRTMRSVRVLARRCGALVDTVEDARAAAPDDASRGADDDVLALATLVDDIAVAAHELGDAFGAGRHPARAQALLEDVVRRLDPRAASPESWAVQATVLLLRSLVVDMRETSGLGPRLAREGLPEL